MKTFEVRPSRPDDFLTFVGELPCYRAKSWTGLEGDKIIGIGGYGYAPNGAIVMFLKTADGASRKYPKSLCALARHVMDDALQVGRNIVAECDENIEAAERFLRWLGFEPGEGLFVHPGNR